MKLKYFDDISDDTVCLIRIDCLDSYHERFFVLDKEVFYTLKKTDGIFETDADVHCWPLMHVPVKTELDGSVYIYDKDTSTYKPIAAWTYELSGTGIKYVMLGHKLVGIILPSDQSNMYLPLHYSSLVFSVLHDMRLVSSNEADSNEDEPNEEELNEEGPNEDVTMSDGLCLISTSDKTRFLQELSSRQKSGYELCSMSTSCMQVDGKLQVVFSSLKAKEDKKHD